MRSSKWLVFIRSLLAGFDRSRTIVNDDGSNQVSDAVLAQLKEGGRLILPTAQDGNIQVMGKAGHQVNLMATRSTRLPPTSDNKVQLEPPLKMQVMDPQ